MAGLVCENDHVICAVIREVSNDKNAVAVPLMSFLAGQFYADLVNTGEVDFKKPCFCESTAIQIKFTPLYGCAHDLNAVQKLHG